MEKRLEQIKEEQPRLEGDGEAPTESQAWPIYWGAIWESDRLLACIFSRPGQFGCANVYILESKELEFYMKKIQKKGGRVAWVFW